MQCRLHRFSLVTVTLLLSLTSTLQLVGIPPEITVASAQTPMTQNRKAEADRLRQQGIEQFEANQLAAALELLQKALFIYQEIGDRFGQGNTLTNIGTVYYSLGKADEAIHYWQQSLPIARQVGDRPVEQKVLANLGAVYNDRNEYAKAIEYYQKASEISRLLNDRQGEEKARSQLGIVYLRTGDYPKALESLRQSLGLARELNDSNRQQRALGNLGIVYYYLSDYALAIEYHQQSLAISQKLGDRLGEGRSLGNLGLVYKALGDRAKALEYYKRDLAIARELGNEQGEAQVLGNIGIVYKDLAEYSKAIEYHEQSLAIARKLGDRLTQEQSLGNLNLTYQFLGDYAKAIEYGEQTLAIARDLGHRQGEMQALLNLGLAYEALKDTDKALAFYQQTLVMARALRSRLEEGMVLNNLGVLYRDASRFKEAEENLRTAVGVWESVRAGLGSNDKYKVDIFEIQAITYRTLQEVLIAQNRPETALEIAERGRARAFVELLSSRLSKDPNNLPTTKAPTLQEIQQIAKVQQATLVEYSVVTQGLYIWVVKPTGEVAFKQTDLKSPNASPDDLVIRSRDSIGVRGRGIGVTQRVNAARQTNQLQQLHQLLIAPIAEFLPTDPNSRVIFIPQGSLFLVPFAALQDDQGKYLIEKHTILTAPAIQVLELTHKQRQQVSGKGMLVVGNPTMPKIGEPPTQLPSLPGAEREALAIAQLFNTKAITGNLATKAAIVQQLSQARIAHLATHGLLDDFKGQGVPGAIALAPSNNDNGLLTSSEILDLKLNAELVVLSACDTGRGRITGDGVIGLSRSWITAGVPSLIVSLWSVPDAPTASLMTEFYRQIQQKPDKAQALRQAMLTTMKQNPDPKDWAAFTLIGEAE
jgi:CHAT domain-containing protein/Tfp pilus assembly protein PilF